MIGLLVFVFFPIGGDKGASKDLSYTKFTAYIDNDAVASVKVYDDNTAEAKIRPESYALVFGNQEAGEDVKGKLNAQVPSVEEFAKYIDNVNVTRKENGKAAIDVSYAKSKDYWYMILVNILPIALIVLFFVWMSRGMANAAGGGPGGIFNVGKAKAAFKMTGKVTVTVSSTSGSYVEASTSYTFMINEGYNVSTFEEANTLLRSSKYNGQIVNFVVLERPVAQAGANAYTYGYSLVPPAALKPQSEQTVADIRGGNSNRLQVVNKNAIINGNNHPIDGSQMRRYTEAELTAWMKATGRTDRTALDNIPSLFSVEAWSSDSGGPADSSVTGKDYIVKLYNLHVIGNASIDYDPNHYNDPNDPVDPSTSSFVGAYNIGISVGSRTDMFDVDYYLEAENMSATGFRNGFNFNGIVDGNVKELYAGNCYSTGIAVKASIMKLSSLTFGACGATAIELAPDECDKAGVNNNQNQQVIIDGEINASNNYNDMNTTYFQNYTISGTPVSAILAGNVQAYMLPGNNSAVIDHIRNANGQFIFVSLIFNDMSTLKANTSVVTYPSYQAGGIIDIATLAANVATTGQIDTTHQFIRVPIMVPMGSTQVQAGTALFYNHNYGK